MKIITILITLIAALSGCSNQTSSEQIDVSHLPKIGVATTAKIAEKLSAFDRLEPITNSKPSLPLLNGEVIFAVSDQKWNDATMGAFASRHGKHPTMTILTAPASDSSMDDTKHGASPLKSPWFLYTNYTKELGNQLNISPDDLSNLIAYAYSESAQQRLSEAGLTSLPEPLRRRALVAHGMLEPQFEKGYK